MSSAMEAEIADLYMNAQLAIKYCQITDMGHPQPPTLMQTDNKSADGIVHGTMKQKRSKAIDMQFHWLKDCAMNHKQIDIRWAPRAGNLGDYPTKHHLLKHHRTARPIYLHVPGESPTTLQGCAEILRN